MTKTEKNTVPATAEPLPVDAKKLIEALGTIFGGVIQLLTAVEPDIAKELADFAINGESQKKLPENLNLDDFEEIISEEESAGVKITGRVQDVIELTGKAYDLNQPEQDNILNYLIQGGDLSLYGLSNAVTRASSRTR